MQQAFEHLPTWLSKTNRVFGAKRPHQHRRSLRSRALAGADTSRCGTASINTCRTGDLDKAEKAAARDFDRLFLDTPSDLEGWVCPGQSQNPNRITPG